MPIIDFVDRVRVSERTSVVVETTLSETKTLPRPESSKTKTRQRL